MTIGQRVTDDAEGDDGDAGGPPQPRAATIETDARAKSRAFIRGHLALLHRRDPRLCITFERVGAKAALGGAGLLLVVVACGSHDETGASRAGDFAKLSHVSGSRLRARVVEADGVVAFLGWTDTQLGVACDYALAGDGELRCLPSGGGPSTTSACAPLVMYEPSRPRDPGCPASADPPDDSAYAWKVVEGSCATQCDCAANAPRDIFRRGAALPCAPDTIGQPYEAIRIDPTTFVRAHVETIETGGRLALRVAVGDDGSRRVLGAFDTARARACEPLGMLAGTSDTTCIAPEEIAWAPGIYFSEASCTSSQEVAYATRCMAPAFVVLEKDNCNTEMHQLGPRLDGQPIFTSLGSCREETDQSHAYYAIGPSLEANAVETLIPTRVGSGRIVARAWTASGNLAFSAHDWVGSLEDVELGACTSVYEIGGTPRCGTNAVGRTGVFADDACTVPIVPTSDGCKPPPAPRLVAVPDRSSASCSAELHELGAPYDGPLFYDNQGTCLPYVPAVPFSAYYRVGAPADPSRLAALTFRQE